MMAAKNLADPEARRMSNPKMIILTSTQRRQVYEAILAAFP
jgi:hypothetical protein